MIREAATRATTVEATRCGTDHAASEVMTEGGFAIGLNHAIEQRAVVGWVVLSPLIPP
jgi:hypothetical protein